MPEPTEPTVLPGSAEPAVLTGPIGLTGPTESAGLAGPTGLPEAAGLAVLPGPTGLAEPTVAVIACGALGAHVREIVARRGWHVQTHCLPAWMHNKPSQIAPAAERLARRLRREGLRVVLAYADCGTYGELDRLCERLGLARLRGLHCYDVFAGEQRIRAELEAEPGTYLLTDFLVRGFRRSVLEPLGLDRHPELWADYFGNYRRLVWLRQSADAGPPEQGPTDTGPTDTGLADAGLAEQGLAEQGLAEQGLAEQAAAVAAMFGLPLDVIDVGVSGLEHELESLLGVADVSTLPHPGTRPHSSAGDD